MRRIKRRTVLFGLAGLSLPLIASGCTGDASDSQTPTEPASNSSTATGGAQEATVIRIGHQRFSDLDLIRIRGSLEQLLQEQNATVEWSFFQAGPPLLEAMNAGSLDFGGVGDAPPIFAQAAGAQFYYVGVTPRGPETQDIIVRSDSPIQTAADLVGKRVALQRGSSAHYLLVEVLREQNIPVEQVEVVSLPPADARAAFEQGTVDAWSIWDPFLAVAEATGNVRNLRVGRERRAFFLASQQFAENKPDLVKTILQAARENEQWGQQNARQIAEQFAGELDIDADILELVNQRRQWGLFPIDEGVLAAQQRVADTFYEIGVIPQAVQVNQVALPEQEYAQVFPVS
jgi:sulfonate transport system substrate-binding protein